MEASLPRVRRALGEGLRRALGGYIWLLKILIPVSLATALLDCSGWLQQMDAALKPAMATLSLPPPAALPILIGMTAGVYGALAAMAVLPLSTDHITIITVFILIAHNLPQEGIIQARSGINFVKTTLVRIIAAFATGALVAWCLQAEAGAVEASIFDPVREWPSMEAFLQNWIVEMLQLGVKVLVIVIGVMALIELMKEFSLIDVLVRLFAPALRMMGLHQRAGVLWLTGVIFGLAYGGAVIVEESISLRLDPEEVEKLQLSIGINHSMIEDPLLFLPLGVNPFWLLVPRLLAAVAAVYTLTIWFKFKKSLGRKAA